MRFQILVQVRDPPLYIWNIIIKMTIHTYMGDYIWSKYHSIILSVLVDLIKNTSLEIINFLPRCKTNVPLWYLSTPRRYTFDSLLLVFFSSS